MCKEDIADDTEIGLEVWKLLFISAVSHFSLGYR